MINSKHLLYSENLETINKNIKGGYEGLEYLFNSRITYYKNNNYKLNHNNFLDFYSGVPVEIIGIEEDVFIKNNGKIKNLNFENFYEEYFQFHYDPTSSGVFHSIYNVLQEVIGKLREISLGSDFESEEKKMLFSDTVVYLSNEIERSLRSKRENNPMLFSKLNYMKNGYILLYNKIWEIFSVWIVGLEKINFDVNLPIEIGKTYKDCIGFPWFQVGLLFAKGEIQKYKEQNPNMSNPKIAEYFGDEKFVPNIKAVFGQYKTDKDIYSRKDKMLALEEYCAVYNIEMCEEFKEKLEIVKKELS